MTIPLGRISVVIPTWNRARMVTQAVLAALAQTRLPDEVVVSDDASTDDTYSVLSDLASKEPRLKVVRQETNTGGIPNFNLVIEASTGDFIVWCSDDDRLLPDHIEICVGYLEDNPDIDLVHAEFLNVNETSQKEEKDSLDHILLERAERNPLKSNECFEVHGAEIVPYLIRHYNWPFHPSTLVFRRCLWDKVGKFNPDNALADTDWFVRAAMHGTIVYLPRYSVLNRRHEGNWSIRVGSLKMQRAVYDTVESAINSLASDAASLRLTFYHWLWRKHYQYILARIYVSRSRAGMFDVAQQAGDELLRVSTLLRLLMPSVLWRGSSWVISHALRGIQLTIPGGRAKYENLGKFIPK